MFESSTAEDGGQNQDASATFLTSKYRPRLLIGSEPCQFARTEHSGTKQQTRVVGNPSERYQNLAMFFILIGVVEDNTRFLRKSVASDFGSPERVAEHKFATFNTLHFVPLYFIVFYDYARSGIRPSGKKNGETSPGVRTGTGESARINPDARLHLLCHG